MPIKQENKNLQSAFIHILCNPNNIIVVATNAIGNVIVSKSSGTKFHGNQKTTPFASQTVMTEVVKMLKEETKITKVSLIFRGSNLNNMKESVIKSILEFFEISTISIDQNIPYGGCRPKKKRRI